MSHSDSRRPGDRSDVSSMWRTAISGLVAIALAVVGAELFLGLLLSRTIYFHWWFTPGAWTVDARLGARATPGYRGAMRHRSDTWHVPLRYDEFGLRPPIRKRADDAPRKVLILGGSSIMMCYGLPDDRTVAHHLAESSEHGLTVRSAALAGVPTLRNYQFYRHCVGPGDDSDVVLVCFLDIRTEQFEVLARADAAAIEGPVRESVRVVDGRVFRPAHGYLGRKLDTVYYSSFLLHKAVRLVDRFFMPPVPAIPDRFQPFSPGRYDHLSEQFRVGFVAFLRHVHRTLGARGARVFFVFLPDPAASIDKYGPCVALVPDDLQCLDLHKELFSADYAADQIAFGHYGPRVARLVGERLARVVDELLRGR